MAGSGWRAWTRERLPSAWLQTYLQDQVVARFSSAAARLAALAAPGLNQFSVRDDALGQLEYWDGAAWQWAGTGKRQRLWAVARVSANTSDVIAAALTTVVTTGDLDLPAGDYAIGFRSVVSGTALGAGFTSVSVNTVGVGVDSPRADIIVINARHVFFQEANYVHPGGLMNVRGLVNITVGTPTIHTAGTQLYVKYLGPR